MIHDNIVTFKASELIDGIHLFIYLEYMSEGKY